MIELTDNQKRIVQALGSEEFTVEFLENFIFPSESQSYEMPEKLMAYGFYAAVRQIEYREIITGKEI